jgi:hypothetical protein
MAPALPVPVIAPEPLKTTRPGAPFEAVGTVMILVGMGTSAISCPTGAVLVTLGFVVFLVGRFK